MTHYALFLRGINVGGIRVPMPELRDVLTRAGCRDVATWLNTGNVMVEDDRDAAALKAPTEKAIGDAFGYEAHLIVRPAAELSALVAAWPYGSDESFHRYVVFGGAAAYESAHAARRRTHELGDSGEAVTIIGDDLMWRCPKGSTTTSPVAKDLAKKHLKPLITTRNLNTVEKMVAAPRGS